MPTVARRKEKHGKTRARRLRARVFWSGRSQAIRLPKEMRLSTDEVLISREGSRLVIEPVDIERDSMGWPIAWWELAGAAPTWTSAIAASRTSAATSWGRIVAPDEHEVALRFLLDTNTVGYHLRRSSAALQRRLRTTRASSVALSVVTEMEILYGLERNPALRIAPLVKTFLAGITVLPLDSGVAREYAKIRAALEARGKTIGPLDLMIAAHAVARRLTLITSNLDEFQRVSGLACEDWTAEDIGAGGRHLTCRDAAAKRAGGLAGPRCGCRRNLIAVLTQPEVIEAILVSPGLPPRTRPVGDHWQWAVAPVA